MKKYFKYTAAAVSAAAMVMSSVPAMAAETDTAVKTEETKTEKKDNTVVKSGDDRKAKDSAKNKTVIGNKTEEKAEEKAEEAKPAENTETKVEEKADNTIVKTGDERKSESSAKDKTVIGGKEENETEEKPEEKIEEKTDENTENKTDEDAVNDEAAETVGYSVVNGTINEISTDENGNVRISVETEERGEIVYNEDANGMVIEDNTLKTVNELKAGMKVAVVMDDMAPMTMSLPPQTTAMAFVIEGENPSFTAVEEFDNELSSKTLKLNIDESVTIIDILGSKKTFTADDIKGRKAIVVYGASTKSIPAQTTPYIVVVLESTEETPEEIVSLPLRTALEDMGYTIEWKANDAPIVLTKGETKAEIKIGNDNIVVDGDMVYELSEAVKIVDGVTYVPSDIKDILK